MGSPLASPGSKNDWPRAAYDNLNRDFKLTRRNNRDRGQYRVVLLTPSRTFDSGHDINSSIQVDKLRVRMRWFKSVLRLLVPSQ